MHRFKLTLHNPARVETWCSQCVGFLVTGDGVSCPDGGSLPLSDVLRIEPLFGSEEPCAWCTWCESVAEPPKRQWLSERMIARLPPLRRAHLERRTFEHVLDAEQGFDARGNRTNSGPAPHVERCTRVAGRAAAIITNLESRHG